MRSAGKRSRRGPKTNHHPGDDDAYDEYTNLSLDRRGLHGEADEAGGAGRGRGVRAPKP